MALLFMVPPQLLTIQNTKVILIKDWLVLHLVLSSLKFMETGAFYIDFLFHHETCYHMFKWILTYPTWFWITNMQRLRLLEATVCF